MSEKTSTKTGPADQVIDPRFPISTGPSSDVIEQGYVCNHICKDFKQFSYSISCWAGVVSVSSHDDGQTSPLPLDASVFLVKTTADPGSAQ